MRQSEANKEKEELRRSLNDQRRRLATLEETLVQKMKEYERALAAEETKHRAEIRDLLNRNPNAASAQTLEQQQPTMWKRSASISNLDGDVSVAETTKREKQSEQVNVVPYVCDLLRRS